MKTWVLAALLGFAAHGSELLTPAQKKEVLQALDSICGDTWCEGEYDYRFVSASCHKVSFRCRFGVNLRYEGRTTRHACEVEGIRRYSDLVVKKHVTDRFYRQMTDCVSSLEPDYD